MVVADNDLLQTTDIDPYKRLSLHNGWRAAIMIGEDCSHMSATHIVTIIDMNIDNTSLAGSTC